jgi:hypothetical protein
MHDCCRICVIHHLSIWPSEIVGFSHHAEVPALVIYG